MPLDFPASPTPGQTYTGLDGAIWAWDGSKWLSGTGANAYAPIFSPMFQGDPKAPNPPAGDEDTSISTTSFVAAAVATAQNNVGRNLLHNGLFNVAQRGAGPFTQAGSGPYTMDRWMAFRGDAGDTFSTSLAGFSDAQRAAIGDEAATVCFYNVFVGSAAAGGYVVAGQRIEGVRRLAGKVVVASFWAAAVSGAPKLGVSVDQIFGTGGSPSAAVLGNGTTVTLSTTLTRYTVTLAVPPVAGKTLGTNGDDFTAFSFWYSAGSTAATRSGNVGVQSGTVFLWGVQLEIGSVATPLEKPDPQVDLANCQRFYSITLNFTVLCGVATSLGGYVANLTYPNIMRATPTLVAVHIGGSVTKGVTFGYQTVSGCTAWLNAGVVGDYETFTLQASADL